MFDLSCHITSFYVDSVMSLLARPELILRSNIDFCIKIFAKGVSDLMNLSIPQLFGNETKLENVSKLNYESSERKSAKPLNTFSRQLQ